MSRKPRVVIKAVRPPLRSRTALSANVGAGSKIIAATDAAPLLGIGGYRTLPAPIATAGLTGVMLWRRADGACRNRSRDHQLGRRLVDGGRAKARSERARRKAHTVGGRSRRRQRRAGRPVRAQPPCAALGTHGCLLQALDGLLTRGAPRARQRVSPGGAFGAGPQKPEGRRGGA